MCRALPLTRYACHPTLRVAFMPCNNYQCGYVGYSTAQLSMTCIITEGTSSDMIDCFRFALAAHVTVSCLVLPV